MSSHLCNKGSVRITEKTKARLHGQPRQLSWAELCSFLPLTVAEGSLTCFAESVFHWPYHTAHPPKISRLFSKPLLRASAFCTNINILHLPRQPAVKNSFSSKFCFDSLLLSLSFWKLDKLHTYHWVFQALVHSLIFYRLNSKAAKQYVLLKMLY